MPINIIWGKFLNGINMISEDFPLKEEISALSLINGSLEKTSLSISLPYSSDKKIAATSVFLNRRPRI